MCPLFPACCACSSVAHASCIASWLNLPLTFFFSSDKALDPQRKLVLGTCWQESKRPSSTLKMVLFASNSKGIGARAPTGGIQELP